MQSLWHSAKAIPASMVDTSF